MSLYGPLAKLEEERRARQLRALDIEFEQVLRNLEEVRKVNEEAYIAKRALLQNVVRQSEQVTAKAKPKKKK